MYLPRSPNRKTAPSPTGRVSFPTHSHRGFGGPGTQDICLPLPPEHWNLAFHTTLGLLSFKTGSHLVASAAHSAPHSYPLIRLNIPRSTVHFVTHSLRYKYFYPFSNLEKLRHSFRPHSVVPALGKCLSTGNQRTASCPLYARELF